MSLRHPIGTARGLGSAKEGTHHWWWQRVTAIALVPLTLWLVVALLAVVGADHAAVVSWMRSPVVTVLLLSFLIIMFYHLQLGIQVVLEDYLHTEWQKLTAQLLQRAACFVLSLAGAVAVLKISLSG